VGKVTVGEDRIQQPDQEFTHLTDPFRRELLAYCYRMLGSVHDAEDLVQETYLRAWRSYSTFEGRSSLRTWLHRIATNACLNALAHSSRRMLPTGLGGPADDPDNTTTRLPEVTWLEPMPDGLMGSAPDDPATIVASRAGMRLALIAAMQHLPPQQRAVLILRDVLAWPAADVAEILDTTTVAVNSALQRARVRMEKLAPASDDITEPDDPRRRELLDRFAVAFEKADIPALTRLLTEDAVWEMPPLLAWFAGREAIGRLLTAKLSGVPGGIRTVPTRANGQSAFAIYLRRDDGAYHPHSIQLPTVTEAGISRVVGFHHPALFAAFGLPLNL
jgi:RNA polymerase sigma-70 factor, ECF subfamily